MKVALAALVVGALAASSAGAADLHLRGALEQGGFVEGSAAPGAKITLDGKRLAVAPDGSFVFGFGRDAKRVATLAIVWPDGRRERQTLSIAGRKWRIQRIAGLPRREGNP